MSENQSRNDYADYEKMITPMNTGGLMNLRNQCGNLRNQASGQALLEYLAVAGVIMAAIAGLSVLVSDPGNGMAKQLTDKVEHQLVRTGGTADNLLQ